MPLCEQIDVATVLGVDPGDVDDLIDLVTGILEGGAGVGRPISDVTPTAVSVDGNGRVRLELGDWPLAAVTDVVDDGTALVAGTDYLVDLVTGTLIRLVDTSSTGRWSTVPGGVTATITRTIPIDLRALCARIVARIWRAQQNHADLTAEVPELAGLTQLTVGQWSATVERAAVDPAALLSLTDLDLVILDAWRDRRP